MMKVLVLAVALVVVNLADAQILKQPSAGTLFVPVNNRANFSCITEENYSIDWEATLRNITIRAAREFDRATFTIFGFAFDGIATSRSTLSFGIFDESGGQTNNVTRITCLARQGAGTPLRGNEVQVIFYDAPPPPADLSVTENELGSLNIMWSLGFIEEVPVNYTLTVLNLNTASAQVFDEIQDKFYELNTGSPCDVYSFTVTAVTAAGNSTPSQELIFTRNISDMCQMIMQTTTKSGGIIVTNNTETTQSSNRSDVIGGAIGAVVGIVGIVALVGLAILLLIYVQSRAVAVDVKSLDNAKCLKEMTVPVTIAPTSIFADLNIQCFLRYSRNNSTAEKISMVSISPRRRSIIVTPQGKGRYMLGITIDDQHVKGSPFHFEVDLPLKKFQRKRPHGLAISHNRVFLLEEGKKGITSFAGFNPSTSIQFNFIFLGEENLAEIAVHTETEEMFVTTGRTGRVLKLTKEGQLIHSIDSKDIPSLKFPNGLRINYTDNELYVCDTDAHRVEVLDLNLNHLRTITGKMNGCEHAFLSPRDVEFDKNNNVYIAEENRIRVFSHNEHFIRNIGEKKIDVAICLKIIENLIYVTNDGTACVSIYSITDGTHIRDIWKGKTINDNPWGLTIDNEGYVYVSTFRERLLIL